jgi:NAD-dependent dihydropyrimidine dehydrogenase PreA subunit
MYKVLIQFTILVAAVIGLSYVSSRLWGGPAQERSPDRALVVEETMTVAQFGQRNELPGPLLRKVFDLQTPADRQKSLAAFGMSTAQIVKKTEGLLALRAEHGSKNWAKILIKFALWLVFLTLAFVLMVRGRMTAGRRRGLLLAAVAVFGVVLGADPSPMGTVKDAIVLLGTRGVIFPPRLIAFGVFLLLVIVANKFICSWGCQLGTLQDAIFRLNRDREGRVRQFKVSFAVSNGIRIAFLAALVAFAFLWATDIVEGIDPFKTFKPQALGLAGAAFIGATLVLSLFLWRPWCHFLCPFGLVGWTAEKISLFKIHVDYDKCIACRACERACPSTVMGAILRRDRTIPDCFACGTCIETCPSGAISFRAGRRVQPPADKFTAKVRQAGAGDRV